MPTINSKKRGRPTNIQRMQRIVKELHEEQFDEDTAPADIGDIIELLQLIVNLTEI